MKWGKIQGVSWVAVDWGTSNLRIWLMSEDNQVIAQKTSSQGMACMDSASDFEQVLFECLQSLLTGGEILSVVCCGMVGAKQGWHDAGSIRLCRTTCYNINDLSLCLLNIASYGYVYCLGYANYSRQM